MINANKMSVETSGQDMFNYSKKRTCHAEKLMYKSARSSYVVSGRLADGKVSLGRDFNETSIVHLMSKFLELREFK
jgi:hypothetical protein